MRSPDEKIRALGCALLDALSFTSFDEKALIAGAEETLHWLQGVCAFEPSRDAPAEAKAEAKAEAAAKAAAEVSAGFESGSPPDAPDEAAPEAKPVEAGVAGLGEASASASLSAPTAPSLGFGITAGDELVLAQSLGANGLKEVQRLVNLLTALHEALERTQSPKAAMVPRLWMTTAIRCLRCRDKYLIREMGLQLVQEAIKLDAFKGYGKASRKLGAELGAIAGEGLFIRAVLDSLFTEPYTHHTVVRLATGWFLEGGYYKDFCYEDDVVDLMQ